MAVHHLFCFLLPHSPPLLDSRRVVALSAAGADAASACPGARAELGPGSPAPVVSLRLLAGPPDAVALKAPLRERGMGEGWVTGK